jgi:hypothetical protein
VNASGSDANQQAERGWKNDAAAGIAAAQAKTGDLDAANASIDAIPDAETKCLACQYVAQALARAGNISDAQTYSARTNGISRARADGAIAVAQGASGDFHDAVSLANSLGDASEQVEALSRIARSQAKSGDLDGAKHTIALARQAVRNVPDWLAPTAYGEIAMALVRVGDLEGARDMERVDQNVVTRQIAIAQAETGDIAGAKATIEQITDSFSLACANVALAMAWSRAGRPSGADDAMDAARYSAGSISDASDAANAVEQICSAQAKLGDPSSAADWARSQQDGFAASSGLVGIARALPH